MSQCLPCRGHENHLCQLVEKKIDLEKMKKLVKDARYICKNCGRAAAGETSLCAPEKL